MKTFINMLRDDRGASAAEYALILAIIGAVIAIAALGLADAIGNAMDDTANCIEHRPQPPAAFANRWAAVLRHGRPIFRPDGPGRYAWTSA